MHAVLRKMLATKPAALSVGRADGERRVRDIFGNGDTDIFLRKKNVLNALSSATGEKL